MKRIIIFSIYFFIFCFGWNATVKAQAIDMNGNPNRITTTSTSPVAQSIHYDKTGPSWANVRSLSEINVAHKADAYPYISADGLRLYYTHEDTTYKIYCASRSNTNAPFGNPKVLSSVIQDSSRSCWLTNNELEIYYVHFQVLYYASRLSLNDEFSEPKIIYLDSCKYGFISGPSLTPDKKELYLYFNRAGMEIYLLKFKQVSTLEYILTDTLKFPNGLEVSPGQLSKDGLKFYVGLGTTADSCKLYQMERSTLADAFTNLTKLDATINSQATNCIQPTISSDENIFICTINNYNNWIDNDLMIATDKSTGTIEYQKTMEDYPTFYPNPVSTTLHIETQHHRGIQCSIITLQGDIVISKTLNNSNEIIDVNVLSNGMYIIQFSGADWTHFGKLIKE